MCSVRSVIEHVVSDLSTKEVKGETRDLGECFFLLLKSNSSGITLYFPNNMQYLI